MKILDILWQEITPPPPAKKYIKRNTSKQFERIYNEIQFSIKNMSSLTILKGLVSFFLSLFNLLNILFSYRKAWHANSWQLLACNIYSNAFYVTISCFSFFWGLRTQHEKQPSSFFISDFFSLVFSSFSSFFDVSFISSFSPFGFWVWTKFEGCGSLSETGFCRSSRISIFGAGLLSGSWMINLGQHGHSYRVVFLTGPP